jgi:hypothetical protein
MDDNKIKLGKYRHFKGLECEVTDVARHSETLEEMVVYRETGSGEEQIWVRPLKMFLEEVEVNGEKIPRFSPIE